MTSARRSGRASPPTLDEAALTKTLGEVAAQRWAEVDGAERTMVIGTPQALTAASTAIDREFYDYYRTPRGQHPRSTTAFSRTSDAQMMLFWSFEHLDWISPRPVLFITGDQAHSRIFSEHAYTQSVGTEGTLHRSRRRTRRSLRPREPDSVGQASVVLRQASRRGQGRNIESVNGWLWRRNGAARWIRAKQDVSQARWRS